MKHRSIGAFLLLAATLFAIPQAVEDIRSLKGAIFERARGELLQTFLGFNSDEATPAPAYRRLARTVPCPVRQDSNIVAAAKKTSPRSSAQRVESLKPSELNEVVAEFVGELAEAASSVALSV